MIAHCLILLLYLQSTLSCPPYEGCELRNSTLMCNSSIAYKTKNANVTVLEICDLSSVHLPLDHMLSFLPNVFNVTIVNSDVPLLDLFEKVPNIKVFKIAETNLTYLNELDASKLRNLKVLDLRNNNIEEISIASLRALNVSILLADNKWNCSANLSWVFEAKGLVEDLDEIKCFGIPYPDIQLAPVAEFLQNVRTRCPEKCGCSMPNVVRGPDSGVLQPIIEVNCSDKALRALPPDLPKETKILRLERNEIEDLRPLVRNYQYRSVQDLYLDFNLIANIDNLEGSYFLAHFRVFSLIGNDLTQLPTYALDNALQQNPNMPNAVRVYLGLNPWRCDCVFTPGFQDMLMKYQAQMHDVYNVKCSYIEGDDNSMSSILGLSRSSVCRLPSEYSVQALDLLNIVLASLIVLVLGKLAYDYYFFKRTGRLPWIVTKMP